MIEPARPLPAALATAMLALGALVALWTAPAAAKHPASSCSVGAHRRASHPHACARAHRHGSRRRAGKTRHSHRRTGGAPGAGSVAAAAPLRTAPVCEDGHTAVRDHEGQLVCGDGSAPACEEGRTPAESSAGDVLYCTSAAPPDPEEGCTGAGCETPDPGEPSGGTPCREDVAATLEEGSFTCPDGGEPSCPEGTALALSSDETELICEATTTDGERRS